MDAGRQPVETQAPTASHQPATQPVSLSASSGLLRLRVVSQAGSPQPGVSVLFMEELSVGGESRRFIESDSTGTVEGAFTPGQVRVRAYSPGAPFSFARGEFTVERERTTEGELELRQLVSVTGRVSDARSGLPIEGAHLTGPFGAGLAWPEVTTGTDGTFEFPYWPIGIEAGLRVSHPSHGSDTARLACMPTNTWKVNERFGAPASGGTDGRPYVAFELAPTKVIEGVLRFAGSDASAVGLPSFEASAHGLLLIAEGMASADTADARIEGGHFEFSGLNPAVTHGVELRAAGYAPLVVLAPPGQHVDLGQLHLQPGVDVTVRFEADDGRLIPGLEVHLVERFEEAPVTSWTPTVGSSPSRDGFLGLPGQKARSFTDAQGSAAFQNLKPGTYTLSVEVPAWPLHSVALEIEDRRSVDLGVIQLGSILEATRERLPDSAMYDSVTRVERHDRYGARLSMGTVDSNRAFELHRPVTDRGTAVLLFDSDGRLVARLED